MPSDPVPSRNPFASTSKQSSEGGWWVSPMIHSCSAMSEALRCGQSSTSERSEGPSKRCLSRTVWRALCFLCPPAQRCFGGRIATGLCRRWSERTSPAVSETCMDWTRTQPKWEPDGHRVKHCPGGALSSARKRCSTTVHLRFTGCRSRWPPRCPCKEASQQAVPNKNMARLTCRPSPTLRC